MRCWLAGGLFACSGSIATVEPVTEPGCADTLSWAHTGQGFMLNYCTGCHSSHLQGQARFGAPSDVDLDTLGGVQASLDRVTERTVVAEDMPPGGGPSALELSRLKAWLDCGAPGGEASLPETDAFPSGLAGYELMARVSEASAGLLTVVRELQDVGFGLPNGTYMVEAYELSGDDAWFHGYWIYGSNDEVERELWWDPALHIQGDTVSETQATLASIYIDGELQSEEQEWIWSREVVQGGGLEQDPNPTEIMIIETGGELQLWHLSEERGITTREFWLEDGRSWEFLQQSSDVSLPAGLAFPIEAESNWIERLVLDKGGTR